MNSTNTVDIVDRLPISQPLETGTWYKHNEFLPERHFFIIRRAKSIVPVDELAFSSFTAINDPWNIERKQRDTGVSASIYKDILGHSIPRSKALQIARQILEQAEQERLEIAEIEATMGIQWGDSP